MPVKSRGLVIGTLCIATRNLRTFLPEEQELLAAIGSQVGIAIENARLYREVRNSEEKYRDLFENASAAIFVHNLAGEIVDANRACLDLTGYPREELIHMNVNRLGLPETNEALQQAEKRLLKSEPAGQPYEMRLRRKDGTESIVSLSTRVITGNGHPSGFEHIARDITEQKRMRQSLDFYLKQILTTQEEERKRIARELHDETAQSLLLISQRLDSLSSASGQGASGPARQSLEEVRGVALKALADVRRLTQDLRPRILDDLGLTAVLEWMTDDLKKKYGVNAGVKVTGTERRLTPETQLLLFRIAQEALSNIRRHAEASAAGITLEFSEGKVQMTVEDNGKGFKVPDTLSHLAGAGKLGLLGMHERARLVGGSVVIRSELGKGTTVVVELPV
ncbi:MAG: domain S-box protein [Dehalococcoidia bacterium]|nr:domain S-box protein [Dehalococcoidia bacterium]